MKRFSELGIKIDNDKRIFNCPQVSIMDILNKEIQILGFLHDLKTKHGEGRYLVHFLDPETSTEGKFFTNSASLKAVLDQVPEGDFPFLTTIKATQCGNGKVYQFT